MKTLKFKPYLLEPLRSMKKNSTLTKRLHEINQLLIELYEEIDKNYTESLERNDKLSMNRAKSELELATKILDEVEKI